MKNKETSLNKRTSVFVKSLTGHIPNSTRYDHNEKLVVSLDFTVFIY